MKRKIMWKTTTYARIHTLEETLYSFLNQDDLENVEMIVVNDYPLQTLIFDHPQVKIFNIKEPFKTIGEKDNFCIEQSDAEIIAVCDDDDIYLPNHNTNIRKYFKEDSAILHWNGVYYNEPDITSLPFIGNSGMVYSKKAWEEVGKHGKVNAGGDTIFANSIHNLHKWTHGNVPKGEESAFYRWNLPGAGGIYHQSGAGFDKERSPNIIQRHSAHIEHLRKLGLIPTGEIKLNPRWSHDYQQLLKDYVSRNPIADLQQSK